MPVALGASVAIIHCGRVLLTKRDDFEVWSLPGGEVDPGESVAEAAVREGGEETGLELQLTRLVGIYSLPSWLPGGHHIALFAARPIGGEMRPQVGEVIGIAYFEPSVLPEPLIWWQRRWIHDAVRGVGGSVAWSQRVVWPFEAMMTQQELYELAARSGLSRQEFFLCHFSRPEGDSETLEVPEVGGR